MKVCEELNNGKTTCDLWNLFRLHGFEPCEHNIGLLSAHIALFIGLNDESVAKEFEDGIKKCKPELFDSIEFKE